MDVSADINGSVSFTGAGGSWQGTVPASQLFAGAGEPGRWSDPSHIDRVTTATLTSTATPSAAFALNFNGLQR